LRRPLPSTSPNEPGFHPRGYWRGPVRPVVVCLIWWSLLRAGAHQQAESLRRAALAGFSSGQFAEYYEPFTGEPLGSDDQMLDRRRRPGLARARWLESRWRSVFRSRGGSLHRRTLGSDGRTTRPGPLAGDGPARREAPGYRRARKSCLRHPAPDCTPLRSKPGAPPPRAVLPRWWR
jgi:hypothetical protein